MEQRFVPSFFLNGTKICASYKMRGGQLTVSRSA